MNSLRVLLKAPGFSLVAVLTLALGIGAATAVFSVVYSILLQPLPFADSDRLVSVRVMVKRDAWERRNFSSPEFRDYRTESTGVFSSFSAVASTGFTLTGAGDAARVAAERVSHDYFATLGVAPARGRTFTAAEDAAPGGPALAVLGHDLWRNQFAAAPDIVGRQIRLNETSFTVVGVMPPGFRGWTASADLWVPMAIIEAGTWNNRGNRWHDAVARLQQGVAPAQADPALSAIGARLAAAHPATHTNYSAVAVPLREELFGTIREPLVLLLGAVAAVLLLAWGNVANLLLVRLAGRRREFAVRLSLGATRGALARQVFAESTALAIAGGALGLVFASWIVAALARWSPVELPAFVTLSLSPAAVLFGGATAALGAVVVGALPALLAGRADAGAELLGSGRATAGRVAQRTRAVLVAASIAGTFALVVAGTLITRSFARLVAQSPGFRTERTLVARVALPPQRYPARAIPAFTDQLVARAAALPGVLAAAVASDTPLSGGGSATFFTVEGENARPDTHEGRAYTHIVSPGFFRAAGIALLQGETFAETYAAGADRVAIVSAAFARRFWPQGDAVGRRFKPGRADSAAPWIRIIGVVAETKYRGLVANPTRDPDIYAPLAQMPSGNLSLILHTAGDSAALAPALARAVAALDPTVPVYGTTTMERRVAEAAGRHRFVAQVLGGFSAFALLLAGLSLYSVVAFSVGQRTREIGIRMALGALPAGIVRLVARQAAALLASGLALGCLAVLALERPLAPLLFAVDSRDPTALALAAGALAAVVLLATWLPARRAARVNPIVALRVE